MVPRSIVVLLAAAAFVIAARPVFASGRSAGMCAGSPLQPYDNVGTTLISKNRTVRTVVAAAKLLQARSDTVIGWYYLDDAGERSVILNENADQQTLHWYHKRGTSELSSSVRLSLEFLYRSGQNSHRAAPSVERMLLNRKIGIASGSVGTPGGYSSIMLYKGGGVTNVAGTLKAGSQVDKCFQQGQYLGGNFA